MRAVYTAARRYIGGCSNSTKPIWNGAIAQLVERLNGIQEVRGSTPLGSTIFPNKINILKNNI